MSVSKSDIETVLTDLNDIRARPETMVSRFKTVLFSFKGFGKQTDQLALFVEEFIEKLPRMKKLQELKQATEIDSLAQAILDEYEKNKINPSNLPVREIDNFAKPFIKNYGKISILSEEQRQAGLLLNKLILKKDEDKNNHRDKNVNHEKLFDPKMKYCGIAAKRIERVTYYVIILVDQFEKVKKYDPNLVSPEELIEYKTIFDLFDDNKDGLIIPQEFNDKLESMGIAKSMPSILKFGKYFNDPKFKRGVDFDGYVEAIIEFGNFEEEDGIRRIFELYVDDWDKYTITLDGIKRIVKHLNVGELQDQIQELFKYAVNKDVDLSYKEFKDYMTRGIKEGKIKIPNKI